MASNKIDYFPWYVHIPAWTPLVVNPKVDRMDAVITAGAATMTAYFSHNKRYIAREGVQKPFLCSKRIFRQVLLVQIAYSRAEALKCFVSE
jgi:hypothetical protein